MCGICGGFALTEKGRALLGRLPAAVDALHRRGPDGSGTFTEGSVALGHTRLAVIDTSAAAAQPFTDSEGKHTIVFNGEIFNYRELRRELEQAGEQFRTGSDTEVLLRLWIRKGEKALPLLNGFFAFAIYSHDKKELFIARDRYGEKPLYICHSGDGLFFASELKSLLCFGIQKRLDQGALRAYLHLNYVPPGNWSVFEGVQPLQRGQYAQTEDGTLRKKTWYSPPAASARAVPAGAEKKLEELLEAAVQRRMIADVPLGAFLSGGIDSSVVAALAARHTDKLHTFSIGFPDAPHFDETQYARLVARHIGAEHTVFGITEKEMLDHVFETLNYLDEPFADSSALALGVLAKKTRGQVTVALSGDGADELFAGYHKHRAEYMARHGGWKNMLIKNASPVWQLMPASRNSKTGNRIRQLRRFAEGLRLDPKMRYWRWAGFTGGREADELLTGTEGTKNFAGHYQELTAGITGGPDMNDFLHADFHMVLEGDMLVKVDRMSMCHGLEVRSPFLDHELAEFVLRLPASCKINAQHQKVLLKKTFAGWLPQEIFSRRKQGFEVPLHKWLTGEMRGLADELLAEKFLKEQNIFRTEEVKKLRAKMLSNDPGDTPARIWGLVVFQYWWKKYYSS